MSSACQWLDYKDTSHPFYERCETVVAQNMQLMDSVVKKANTKNFKE